MVRTPEASIRLLYSEANLPRPVAIQKLVLKRDQVILSVGGNAELLWLREHVLKAAGFKVVSTTSESKAVAEMQQGKCAVLLLCHSLPDAVRSTVSKQFRQYCPHARILGITNVRWPQALDEVDSYVYGLEGPEVLIAAIRSAAAERSDAA